MDTFFAALGRFVVRFRSAVIVGWIVFGGFGGEDLMEFSSISYVFEAKIKSSPDGTGVRCTVE
jgi:hypothetical protein